MQPFLSILEVSKRFIVFLLLYCDEYLQIGSKRKLREIAKIRRFQLQELLITVSYLSYDMSDMSLFDIPIRDTKGHTDCVGFLGGNSGGKRSFLL